MASKWVPLEASPEVFNDWSRPLGLPDAPLSFQDLFSLDPEFLAFTPQPVRSVLLLFPSRGKLAEAREAEEKTGEGKFDGNVWWIKQTISNACGSIGLLHTLLNLPEGSLRPDSPLVKFKAATLPLDQVVYRCTPHSRAPHLPHQYRRLSLTLQPWHAPSSSTRPTFFEEAHTAAAQSGQSVVPTDLDVDTHFIAFVEATNAKGEKRVVELDGGRTGPFDRGQCTDLLHDVAKIVKDKYIDRAEGDINFNMIVLAGEPDD